MPKLFKSIWLVPVILTFFSTLVLADESITITTYYPSPSGVYKNLTAYNQDESTTKTDFTQAVTKAGFLITTDWTDGAYMPGIFWSTVDNNPTKPKAGIYLRETLAGTSMYLGTSNNYATGITNDALVIDPSGNIGIGAATPGALLDLGLAGTTRGVLRLAGNTSGNVTIQPAAAAGTWTMTLPTTAGAVGQQLTTAGVSGITSWAAPVSLRSMKDIIGTVLPDEALAQIINTKVYRFHYKPGMGTGDSDTEYVGVMADEAPWAMHYKGSVVNPVNTLGYMVLGIQSLNEKILTLTQAVSAVQGQQEEIQKQQDIVKAQQLEIDGLKARLDKLEGQ